MVVYFEVKNKNYRKFFFMIFFIDISLFEIIFKLFKILFDKKVDIFLKGKLGVRKKAILFYY